MMDKNTKILVVFLIFLICVLVFIIVMVLRTPIQTSSSKNNNCSRLNLFKTSDCLNSELKSFYQYNISNIGKEISYEQLKNEGGVCSQYANWYKEQAESLGFYGTTVIFSINNSMRHAIAIISNEEGYCLEDQTFSQCYNL